MQSANMQRGVSRLASGTAGELPGGSIALVDLPFQRWSSALAKLIRETVDAAFAQGAMGAILITNGPSGTAIALNADGRAPMFKGPVGVLAPRDAYPFLVGAERSDHVTMHLTGTAGRRTALNVVGRLDRGASSTLVVSTPRSGWFACAGERGGGIAVWLDLVRWAPAALRKHNLIFVSNSGHEYENLGAEHTLQNAMPPPDRTALWLHLGANIASRDWHDLTADVRPLPSVDPQRYLVATPGEVAAARTAFQGQPGLEAVYSSDSFSAGELGAILAAGYRRAIGLFGAHRYHHSERDQIDCAHAPSAAIVAATCKRFLEQII